MKALLLTGFGSFLKVADNPSGALARANDGRNYQGLSIRGRELPVVFDEIEAALGKALESIEPKPVMLLGLGVHKGRQWRVERCARRPLVATKPDVSGRIAATARFRPGAPALLSTQLDPVAIAAGMNQAGFACHASAHAGGYVCDRTYHELLSRAQTLEIPGLFVHIPPYEHADRDRHQAALEALFGVLASSLAAD